MDPIVSRPINLPLITDPLPSTAEDQALSVGAPAIPTRSFTGAAPVRSRLEMDDAMLAGNLESLSHGLEKARGRALPLRFILQQSKVDSWALEAMNYPGMNWAAGLASLSGTLDQRAPWTTRALAFFRPVNKPPRAAQNITTARLYALEMWTKAALKASRRAPPVEQALAGLAQTQQLVAGHQVVLEHDKHAHYATLKRLNSQLLQRIHAMQAAQGLKKTSVPAAPHAPISQTKPAQDGKPLLPNFVFQRVEAGTGAVIEPVALVQRKVPAKREKPGTRPPHPTTPAAANPPARPLRVTTPAATSAVPTHIIIPPTDMRRPMPDGSGHTIASMLP